MVWIQFSATSPSVGDRFYSLYSVDREYNKLIIWVQSLVIEVGDDMANIVVRQIPIPS